MLINNVLLHYVGELLRHTAGNEDKLPELPSLRQPP